MIEYWYCVNIPPRSLVDLKKSGREEKIFGTNWKSFFFVFFVYGLVRFSDWFGSVRVGLVRFTDWFGSRTGSVRGLVRFGSVADRTGSVRSGSKVL